MILQLSNRASRRWVYIHVREHVNNNGPGVVMVPICLGTFISVPLQQLWFVTQNIAGPTTIVYLLSWSNLYSCNTLSHKRRWRELTHEEFPITSCPTFGEKWLSFPKYQTWTKFFIRLFMFFKTTKSVYLFLDSIDPRLSIKVSLASCFLPVWIPWSGFFSASESYANVLSKNQLTFLRCVSCVYH